MFNITNVEPQFVVVQYDITQDHVRAKLSSLLSANGFRRMTYSVWYGLYSVALMEAIKAIAKNEEQKNKLVKIVVITPAFPSDQAELLRQQYETRFLEDFDQAEKKLMWVEQALANEVLHADKDTGEEKPYTAEQILQRIRTIDHLIHNELELAIVRRKEREPDNKNFLESAERLEARIRQMSAYSSRLREACKVRQTHEVGAIVSSA